MQRPDSWLKKTLSMTEVCFQLHPHQMSSTLPLDQLQGVDQKLLSIPKLEVMALAPLFAIIEDQRNVGDPICTRVQVDVDPMEACLTKEQVTQMQQVTSLVKRLSMKAKGQSLPVPFLSQQQIHHSSLDNHSFDIHLSDEAFECTNFG